MTRQIAALRIPEIQALCREFGVVKLETVSPAAMHGTEDGATYLITFPAGYDFGPDGRRFQDLEAGIAEALEQDVTVLTPAVMRNEWLREHLWGHRTTIYEAPARYPFTR